MQNKNDICYTNVVKAGKRRTYFFDVRKTKGEDYFVTITESTRRYDTDGYDRHKVLLYKEDFNKFVENLEDTINHIKNELMPEYDYEEFDRRAAEWEENKANEESESVSVEMKEEGEDSDPVEGEDEMSW